MVYNWDELRDLVKTKTEDLRTDATTNILRAETTLLEEIDKAKNDEVLAALKTISVRMSAIEARLPELETD